MDFKSPLVRLTSPVLNDVEIAKMDVEMPPVEVEDGSAVHHLTPFEGTKYPTCPAQFLERSRVDFSSVIDGEVPVAVWTEVPTSPRSTEVHCLGIGKRRQAATTVSMNSLSVTAISCQASLRSAHVRGFERPSRSHPRIALIGHVSRAAIGSDRVAQPIAASRSSCEAGSLPSIHSEQAPAALIECGGRPRFDSVVPRLPTPPGRCNAGIVVCDICRRLFGGPGWEHLHVEDHSGLVAQILDRAMRQVIVEHEQVADTQGHFDDLVFVYAVQAGTRYREARTSNCRAIGPGCA